MSVVDTATGEVFSVVVTTSDKRGTLYPDVYGPFDNRDDAESFAATVPYEPWHGEGGYQGATVVPPVDFDDPAEALWLEEDEL